MERVSVEIAPIPFPTRLPFLWVRGHLNAVSGAISPIQTVSTHAKDTEDRARFDAGYAGRKISRELLPALRNRLAHLLGGWANNAEADFSRAGIPFEDRFRPRLPTHLRIMKIAGEVGDEVGAFHLA